jgi:two-component system cell cycle sensor histidine kinase/response regulator CckA
LFVGSGEVPRQETCHGGILVVDDEPSLRHLLEIALRREGFTVWLAASGQQALKLYGEQRPNIDLVLLDVGLPDLDGPQTLATLRQVDAQILCCFMSGNIEGKYTEEELLQRGAVYVFSKPFDLFQVAFLLRQLAGKKPRLP